MEIINLGNLESRLKKVAAVQGVDLSSNIYLIGDKAITLVDTGAGNRSNRIQPILNALNLGLKDVKKIILTHTHFDHIGGLSEMQQASKPVIMVHENEQEKLEAKGYNICALKDGDIIDTPIGQFKVIHTPGHTEGSICLYNEEKKTIFTGDTVFPEGRFGRTDLPTGDSRLIIKSLKKLAKLKVEILLAGHGEPVLERGAEDIKRALESAEELF